MNYTQSTSSKNITRYPHNRIHFLFTLLLCLITLSGFYIPQNASAFGGKKKTPEEQKIEDHKKAAKEYNKGLDKVDNARKHAEKSDSTFAFNYRATQNAKARKDYQRALEKFDKALELNPQMHEAYSERGFCFRKLGMLDESFVSYNLCLDLKPDYAPAIEYRGEAFLARNQLDSAKVALLHLERLTTENASDTTYTLYQATLKAAIQQYQLLFFEK